MSTNINIKPLHNLVYFFEDPKNMKIPIGRYVPSETLALALTMYCK